MNWDWFGLIVALFILFFAIIKTNYKGKTNLFSIRPVKDRVIQFATPKRIELILVALYFISFLWWDVLQNKVLDLGADYRVTWFAGITSSALDLAIIILILFHIILMSLFLFSLKSKRTNNFYDIIVGVLAFFGVAIVLSGFLWSIQNDTIRFLFVDMDVISYYHIGVGIELMSGLYWAFTD